MDPKSSSREASRSNARLSEELQDLVGSLSPEFEQKQVHIIIENNLTAEPDPENKAHLLKLSKALLQNALTVSRAGFEVLLELLPSHDHPGYVELRVSDAGPGLKPEDQTSFLENLRADSDPAAQNWGMPGALREAVDLAQSLGGHWWIHSVPDTLTIHRLAIPVNSGSEDAGSNLATTSPEKH